MSPFKKFLSVHGQGSNCRAVPAETLLSYEGLLPAKLLEHWSSSGWCGYGDGLLWVVNPEDLRDPMSEWLGAEAGNAHPILRTAFGDVIFVNPDGIFYLDVRDDSITAMSKNVQIVFEFSLSDDEFLNHIVDRPLFKQASSRLGQLAVDECYGFTPALALGGSESAESLERVKLREYLSILAQLRE